MVVICLVCVTFITVGGRSQGANRYAKGRTPLGGGPHCNRKSVIVVGATKKGTDSKQDAALGHKPGGRERGNNPNSLNVQTHVRTHVCTST